MPGKLVAVWHLIDMYRISYLIASRTGTWSMEKGCWPTGYRAFRLYPFKRRGILVNLLQAGRHGRR